MSSQVVKKLTIIPTPIGNMSDVSERAKVALSSVDVLLCESFTKAKLLYQLLGLKLPRIMRYWQKTEQKVIDSLGELQGHIGLISDAGMPCISDPGYALVRACYENGFEVSAIPGPSALVAAIAMSGVPCDAFQFLGFLPPKSSACQMRLLKLKDSGISGVVYESPHRILRLCKDIGVVFGKDHPISIVKELSKQYEACYRGGVEDVVAMLDSSTIKGEFCVIISKGEPTLRWSNDAEILSKYLSVSDAASACSEMHQVSRSTIYQYLLELKT